MDREAGPGNGTARPPAKRDRRRRPGKRRAPAASGAPSRNRKRWFPAAGVVFGGVLCGVSTIPAAPAATRHAPAAQSGPRLEIEPGEWDFGNTGPGETLFHDFALKNTGDRDLVLGRIASACACAAAVVGTEVVPPDGETVLRVTLETRDYRGILERWLTITSNDRRGARRVMVRAYVEEPGPPRATAQRPTASRYAQLARSTESAATSTARWRPYASQGGVRSNSSSPAEARTAP